MGFRDFFSSRSREDGTNQVSLEVSTSGIRGLRFGQGPEGVLAVGESGFLPVSREKAVTGSFVVGTDVLEGLAKAFKEKFPAFGGTSVLHVALGDEFLRSSMFRAVFERQDPSAKVDEAELKSFLEKAERASRESVEEHLARSSRLTALKLVRSGLEEICIDGYPVPDPVGFAGREVEIALFNVYVEEPFIGFLQTLQKLLGASRLTVTSSPHAVATAHVRAGQDPASGIFVGVGNSLTSVSVVAKGVFLGTKPFAVGSGLFTRAIASNLGLGWVEAEGVQRQYGTGKLSAAVSRKVSGIVARSAAVWGSGVELALEEFAQALDLFPPDLRFFGDDAGLPDFTRVLSEPTRFANVPFLEKRSYTLLSPATLPFQTSVPVPDAAGVVAPCLAYSVLAGTNRPSELDRIVDRATKLAYS